MLVLINLEITYPMENAKAASSPVKIVMEPITTNVFRAQTIED